MLMVRTKTSQPMAVCHADVIRDEVSCACCMPSLAPEHQPQVCSSSWLNCLQLHKHASTLRDNNVRCTILALWTFSLGPCHAGNGNVEQKRAALMVASVCGKVDSAHAGSAQTDPAAAPFDAAVDEHPAGMQVFDAAQMDGDEQTVQQDDGEQHKIYFDASQQSIKPGKSGAVSSRLRKASFVADPIHQTNNKPLKKKTGSTRAAKSRLSVMQ